MSHSDNSNGPGRDGRMDGVADWVEWRLSQTRLEAGIVSLKRGCAVFSWTHLRSLVQNRIKTHPDPIGNGWWRSTPNAESELICPGGRTYNILKIALNLVLLHRLHSASCTWMKSQQEKERGSELGTNQPHVHEWMMTITFRSVWPSRSRRVLLINCGGFCSQWPRSLHKYLLDASHVRSAWAAEHSRVSHRRFNLLLPIVLCARKESEMSFLDLHFTYRQFTYTDPCQRHYRWIVQRKDIPTPLGTV